MIPNDSLHLGMGVGAFSVKRCVLMMLLRRVDLIEDAAVAEMLGLRLRPAAKVRDGQPVHFGKAGNILLGGG